MSTSIAERMTEGVSTTNCTVSELEAEVTRLTDKRDLELRGRRSDRLAVNAKTIAEHRAAIEALEDENRKVEAESSSFDESIAEYARNANLLIAALTAELGRRKAAGR